jgi:hypothetical protein
VERYGMRPQIDFYEVLALTDNEDGSAQTFEEQVPGRSTAGVNA